MRFCHKKIINPTVIKWHFGIGKGVVIRQYECHKEVVTISDTQCTFMVPIRQKIRRICCVTPHCKLQRGIMQPIFWLFYISVYLLVRKKQMRTTRLILYLTYLLCYFTCTSLKRRCNERALTSVPSFTKWRQRLNSYVSSLEDIWYITSLPSSLY